MLGENRKKIILTADDFGKSGKANESILNLAKMGKLDRVSVMSEGVFTAREIEELKNAGVKIDIHLELDWQKKRRGRTRERTAKQVIVFLANYIRRNRVKREWEKQIKKFREIFGRYPDGINSHEYVHFFPVYFKIALKLAGKHGVPFIRFGEDGFKGKRNSAHMILNHLRRWSKNNFVDSRIDSSDFFASIDWIGDINSFMRDLPEGKTEIACHPERKEEFKIVEKYF